MLHSHRPHSVQSRDQALHRSRAGKRVDDKTDSEQLRSRVVKRSIVIVGHKTSVSLEDAFWDGLKSIASSRSVHLSDLVGSIDADRQHCNLSSAIRLFVLDAYRK